MGLHRLAIGTVARPGGKGRPLRSESRHRCWREAAAIDFREGSPAFDQMQRRLILLFRFETAQLELLGDTFPGCGKELVRTGGCAGVALAYNLFRMAGEILKLSAAVEDPVALVFAVQVWWLTWPCS